MAPKKGNGRILSNKDTKLFIEKVREQDCLWDEDNLEYRDKNLKKKMWKKVAEEIKMKADEAEKEWKKLIAAWKAARKRRSTPGMIGVNKPWKFEDEMSFLATLLPEPTRTAASPRVGQDLDESDGEAAENQSPTSPGPSGSSSAVLPTQTPPASFKEDRRREHPTASRVSSPSNNSNTSRVEQIPNGTGTRTPVSRPKLESVEPAPKKARADLSVDERSEKKWREVDSLYNSIKILGRNFLPEAQDKCTKGLINVLTRFKSDPLKDYK